MTPSLPQARSTNSEHVVGHVEPRLWTPPIRELTPETSYGYELIEFADEVFDITLDPWQQWLAIHMGELLPDLRPRFRTVLVLVARQNGKTLLAKLLILFWMVIDQVARVLAMSTNRTYAIAAWRDVCSMAKACPWIVPEIRQVINDEYLRIEGSEYLVAANNRKAGRSLTVHRLLVDEIREHQTWDAWSAATKAMQAVPDGQVVAISNQGDAESVVLDSLRRAAIDYLETGTGDARLGLFEWSAPPGTRATDPEALAAANPNLGDRITLDTLIGDAQRAEKAGGEELATFRTEVLCQKVSLLDGAVDEHAWAQCAGEPLDFPSNRARLAVGLDVAMDGSHASLVAAVAHGQAVHVGVVREWTGFGAATEVRNALPDLIKRVRPQTIGWFPNGPAAAIAAGLRSGWAPRGTTVTEIKGDMTAVCMGLSEQVSAGEIVHPADPMLSRHVTAAQKLKRGDAWVFTRAGSGPVDGAYALAAAVHLARTMPAPKPPLAVV